MTCQSCQTHWFWKKIGRCQRCIDQLTVLSVGCWIVWWFIGKPNPLGIQSIALIFAAFTCNGLLFLHLCVRYLLLPWQKKEQTKKGLQATSEREKRKRP